MTSASASHCAAGRRSVPSSVASHQLRAFA
jgi:hypothetical protein